MAQKTFSGEYLVTMDQIDEALDDSNREGLNFLIGYDSLRIYGGDEYDNGS